MTASEGRPAIPGWAKMGSERLAHVTRVGSLVEQWAGAMEVADPERQRWLRAAWLHDALRDADADELARWAPGAFGSVELWHGPAAASRAAADGETDRGVLDAVRFHSVGSADWDMVGRVLYCADFLEPGRSFDRAERAALARRLPAEPARVFFEVVQRRVSHLIRSGWILPESTVQLWNSLANAESSS